MNTLSTPNIVIAKPFADVSGISVRADIPDDGKRDIDILRLRNHGTLPLSSVAMLKMITLPCGSTFLDKWSEWIV